MSIKKLSKAFKEAYIRLYKESTPSADFDELVKNAKINESGERVIDYNSYTISKDSFESIINNVAKEFKLRGMYKKSFYFEMYLGAAPRIENENK